MAERESGLGTYASDVAAGNTVAGSDEDDMHDGNIGFHSPDTLHDEGSDANKQVKHAEVIQGAEEMNVVEIDPDRDDVELFLKGMKRKLKKGKKLTEDEKLELETLKFLAPERLKAMGFSVE